MLISLSALIKTAQFTEFWVRSQEHVLPGRLGDLPIGLKQFKGRIIEAGGTIIGSRKTIIDNKTRFQKDSKILNFDTTDEPFILGQTENRMENLGLYGNNH